ncbi:hypothetical protein [Martelella soudanensis]|uniref:hypothetical protein n=1 Tax=unclassified Martelella TaxID=2629616 RepID=UPI0015DFD69F|nr:MULTISPECIES: hypothetical protein [unclassified Martelella]
MLKTVLISSAFMLAAANSNAEPKKVSPSVVEQCQAISETFTELSDCLPQMDIYLSTLDAFSEIYPPEANLLLDECEELNTDSIGTAACLLDAIEKAVSISQSLPEGTKIDDPIYVPVSDPARFEALQAAKDAAMAEHPDIRVWYGFSYFPYK